MSAAEWLAPGDEPTVGIEEELLLIDSTNFRFAEQSVGLLAQLAVDPSSAGHDLYEAQIELRSPTHGDAAAAVRALAALRRAVRDAGATAIGVGIHPNGVWGDAAILPGRRYRQVAEMLRGLVRRTPECALHVHLGVADPDDATHILNGLREHLPLFTALAANSPYWFGQDSGMASARAALVRSYPRHGIPPAFDGYGDYIATIDAYRRAFGIADASMVWWDVRLRPTLGTIELRGMDSQSSLRHVAALTALARAVADVVADEPPVIPTPTELLAESAFLAGRDGVSGRILHQGELRSVREVAADTVARVMARGRTRGIEDALDAVAELVEEGGGAARQRRSHRRGGMPALLRQLIADSVECG
jgi:carboxylate-amine ligase